MTPNPPDTRVTVHDYYAAAALEGLLSNTELHLTPERAASLAERHAVAAMERRPERGV